MSEPTHTDSYLGRCLKCKTSGPVIEPVLSLSKNQRQRVTGKCGGCKGNVSTFARSSGAQAANQKKGK